MSFFSRLFGSSKKIANNGKPIEILPPPPVTVHEEYGTARAAALIGMAEVVHPETGEKSWPLSSGSREAEDARYFAVRDADIPALARWAKQNEDRLTAQGYGYRLPSADCDDRADSFQSYRRFFRSTRATLLVLKIWARYPNAALGIGSNSTSHRLNAIHGSSGWWIIEPATGDYCRLEDYPNRHAIRRANLH